MDDLVFLAILVVVIAWILWQKSSPHVANSAADASGQVEVVRAMFPNYAEEDIRRDLARTRSVQRTAENILEGRIAPMRRAPTSKRSEETRSLIEKFGLASRLTEQHHEHGKQEEGSGYGWKDSKEERQELLRRQQEAMVLRARQRMKAQHTA